MALPGRGTGKLTAVEITNWYASPLAVDAALTEPLRALQTTRVAIRGTVRSLLVRRILAPHELGTLRMAGVAQLELSHAFVTLAGNLSGDAIGPLSIMVRAMARVVRTTPDMAQLGNEAEMLKAVGTSVAYAVADDLYPPVPPDAKDTAAFFRKAVLELLTARTITERTLDALLAIDRFQLAARLEERLPVMRAVVPPSREAALERIVRIACTQLRINPPVDALTFDAALAGS